MRQGNDIGTQYRSGIYCYGDTQETAARASLETYQPALTSAGYGDITTEILQPRRFILPRTTISSICTKTLPGIAAWVGRVWSVPWERASALRQGTSSRGQIGSARR